MRRVPTARAILAPGGAASLIAAVLMLGSGCAGGERRVEVEVPPRCEARVSTDRTALVSIEIHGPGSVAITETDAGTWPLVRGKISRTLHPGESVRVTTADEPSRVTASTASRGHLSVEVEGPDPNLDPLRRERTPPSLETPPQR